MLVFDGDGFEKRDCGNDSLSSFGCHLQASLNAKCQPVNKVSQRERESYPGIFTYGSLAQTDADKIISGGTVDVVV